MNEQFISSRVSQENVQLLLKNIYMFKVDNRNTRKRCEISSQLTLKAP